MLKIKSECAYGGSRMGSFYIYENNTQYAFHVFSSVTVTVYNKSTDI